MERKIPKKRSNVGKILDPLLEAKGFSQTYLASVTNTSVPYNNQIMTGLRSANPDWVETAANSLGMDVPSKCALYTASAMDWNEIKKQNQLKNSKKLEIDLTKKD